MRSNEGRRKSQKHKDDHSSSHKLYLTLSMVGLDRKFDFFDMKFRHRCEEIQIGENHNYAKTAIGRATRCSRVPPCYGSIANSIFYHTETSMRSNAGRRKSEKQKGSQSSSHKLDLNVPMLRHDRRFDFLSHVGIDVKQCRPTKIAKCTKTAIARATRFI